MNDQGDGADIVRDTLGAFMRVDGGRLLSSLVANLRNFQLAEDSLQDAIESALVHWTRSGIPSSPSAWLMRAARRKALDRVRRATNFASKAPQIALAEEIIRADQHVPEDETIQDDRLRLIFTCCHPALDRLTSVALTLRSVAGLTTEEIARAFVVSDEAMAQRLVRARHKITQANIPYAVPSPEDLPQRIEAVLTVIYLIFTEGHSASDGRLFRVDLCEEAIRLVKILSGLLPGEPEIEGLMALMLLHHARVETRLGASGEMIALDAQDRTRWHQGLIAEGLALVEQALKRGRPGPFQMQAAIAALHAESPSFAETDWAQIVRLYEALLSIRANPVFELNRIVAMSYSDGVHEALGAIEGLTSTLAAYQPLHAVRADLLARSGAWERAVPAYQRAIELSSSASEKRFLLGRLDIAADKSSASAQS